MIRSSPSNCLCVSLSISIIYTFISLYIVPSVNSSVYLCSVSLLARGFFCLPRRQDNILLVGGLAEPRCSFSIFMTERCGRNCIHTPSHFMYSCSSFSYLSIHPSVQPYIVPADHWIFPRCFKRFVSNCASISFIITSNLQSHIHGEVVLFCFFSSVSSA